MNVDPNFSSLIYSIIALIGGLILLVAGGEFLVSGAIKIAKRAGMSRLLIGLTVVAFGTSMPELFVSINASFSNHSDIMFGNVVGSNIANVGLVLAVSAILTPLVIEFARLRVELFLVTIVGVMVMLFVQLDYFYRPLGFMFTGTLLAYTLFSYGQEAKKNRRDAGGNEARQSADCAPYYLIGGLVLAGLALMWFGSDYFIKGAVDIARYYGLSELIIGLTLAAVGTSLPELASSISAIRRKEGNILVGNIVGSNLFNLLLVLGGTAALKPFAMPDQALYRDLPIMIGYTVILIPISIYGKKIKRWHGFVMLSGYLFYIYSLS
jgi:cation:H+ antiporter